MRILIALVLAASAAFAASRFTGTIPPAPCVGDYDCPSCDLVCQGGRPGGGEGTCGHEPPVYGICVPNCTPDGVCKR